jgi:hypothetical protein
VLPDRDADLAVRRRLGDLLQRQGVMASAGELVNYGGVIAGKAILQDDQQAIGPTGEVLVEAGVQGITPGRLERSRRCTQDYPAARLYAALLTDPSLFAGRLRRLSGTGDAVPTVGEPDHAQPGGARAPRPGLAHTWPATGRGVAGTDHEHRRPGAFSWRHRPTRSGGAGAASRRRRPWRTGLTTRLTICPLMPALRR